MKIIMLNLTSNNPLFDIDNTGNLINGPYLLKKKET
jgi:hypothetical protein